eukprot:364301-Amphidinium_carterae.1
MTTDIPPDQPSAYMSDGCTTYSTRAMCSRHAFDQLSREFQNVKGVHVGTEEHTVSFGFANSQRSISTQQCAPFLFSLPQCLKLGARLAPSLEFMSGPFLGRHGINHGIKLWKSEGDQQEPVQEQVDPTAVPSATE